MTSRAATRGGARGLLLSTSFGPSPLTRGGARPWPAGSVSVFVAVSSRSHHHVLAASARGAPTRPSGPPRPALEGALIPTNKGGNLGGTGLPRTAAAAPSDSGRDCGGILTRAAALGLRTSRRYFSIRPRCLERDGKSAREQYVHPPLSGPPPPSKDARTRSAPSRPLANPCSEVRRHDLTAAAGRPPGHVVLTFRGRERNLQSSDLDLAFLGS